MIRAWIAIANASCLRNLPITLMAPAFLHFAYGQCGSSLSHDGRYWRLIRSTLDTTNNLADDLRLHSRLVDRLRSANNTVIPDVMPYRGSLLIGAIAVALMRLSPFPVQTTLLLFGQHLNGIGLVLFIIVLCCCLKRARQKDGNYQISHCSGLYIHYTCITFKMLHQRQEGLSALSFIDSC